MFVARDEQGRLCNVLEETSPKGCFTCPGCGGRVRYKSGALVRPHFAHVSLNDCHYFSENESAQHLSLKSILYKWFCQSETVELEKCLRDVGQVADLWVNHYLAIEVQCSSLSIRRLQERTQAYYQAGFQVLWLLGKNLWLKERLTGLQRQFLSFSLNMGFHLWELDDDKKELRLRYLIHEDLRGKVRYLTKVFPFGQGNLLTILRQPYARQALSCMLCPIDEGFPQYLAQQLYHKSPKWLALQEKAYVRGENLLEKSVHEWYPYYTLPTSSIGFTQISMDLSTIYAAFDRFYTSQSDRSKQVLYSPKKYLSFPL